MTRPRVRCLVCHETGTPTTHEYTLVKTLEEVSTTLAHPQIHSIIVLDEHEEHNGKLDVIRHPDFTGRTTEAAVEYERRLMEFRAYADACR